MATVSVVNSGLEKIVSDLTECVAAMKRNYGVTSDPVNDDDSVFHRFCVKLEQALESGRKARGLFGSQKCFWNYFCQCLVSSKKAHDGLKFAKVNNELKTSFGRGRAFIRFCLMHHCLADTLQQCFINEKVTKEWYSENSIPSQHRLWSSLIGALYDLNEIHFDLSPYIHDLDDGWPSFARKIFPSTYSWKPPSRSVSISSLNSTMSQTLETTSTSIAEAGDEEKIYLQDKIDQLTLDLAGLKDHENKRELEINGLKEELQEKFLLEQKVKELEAANDKLTKDYEVKYIAWNDKEIKLLKNIVEAEKQASEYIAKHECSTNQLQASSAEKKKLLDIVDQLQGVNHNQEISLKLLENELKYIKDANYEVQISNLNDKISNLQVKNDSLSQKVDELTSKEESLLIECKSKDVLNEELKNGNSHLQKQCEHLQLESAENNEKALRLQSANSELRSLVEEFEGSKSDLLTQLTLLEQETSSLQDELSKKEAEILKVQQNNDSLKDEVESLSRNATDEVDHPVEVVSQECVMCDMQKARALSLSDQVDSLKRQKTKVELEKCEINQKYELLTKEYDESLSDIAVKEKQLLRSETEIVEFKKSMESVDKILRKQELMIDDLEKKLKVSLEDNVKLNYEMKCLQDLPQEVSCDMASTFDEDQISVIKDESLNIDECDKNDLIAESELTNEKIDDDENKDVLKEDKTDDSAAASVPPVVSTASRTLNRLKSLVQEGEEIHSIVESAKEVRSTMINKVQQQEEKLKHQEEVIEQSETRFEHLKTEHVKLLTSESILRYELKEKRKMLEKLKKQLSSSRSTWAAARRLQDAAEADWKDLHDEFAARPKQQSEESGFSSDEAKIPDTNVDSAITSQASSVPEFSGNVVPSKFETREERDSFSGNSDEGSPPISFEMRAQRSEGRLQYLEEQCNFLFMRLVQSSKKSEYLETKINKMLGLNSDGSDTEDNIESIAELDDVEIETPEISQKQHLDLPEENCETSDSIVLHESCGELDESTPKGVLENSPQQRQSSPMDHISENHSSFPEYVENNDVSNDDDIMNETEDDCYVTAASTLEESNNVAIQEHSQLSCDIPYADNKLSSEIAQSEMTLSDASEISETAKAITTATEDSNIKSRMVKEEAEKQNTSPNLAQMELISEDKSDQMKMTIQTDASDNHEVQVKNLLSENQNLKKLLEKALNENSSLGQKELELRKRADFILRKERDNQDERLKNFSVEKGQLHDVIKDLEREIEERDAANCKLDETIADLETTKVSLETELLAVKFQLSAEVIKNERAMKLEELRLLLSTRDEECWTLTDQLKETTKKLDEETNLMTSLKTDLEETKLRNLMFVTKLETQLSQLRKDNHDLMEKLVKLIRDKDMLWQKTDRLTDIQKSTIPGRWMDDAETDCCLNCKAEFSFLFRKHHCRLCGQIFCKDCSNNWVMLAASSSKSRICNSCLINQSALMTVVNVTDESILSEENEELDDKNQTLDESEFEGEVKQRDRVRSLSASASSNVISTSYRDEKDVMNDSVDSTPQDSPPEDQPRLLFRSSSAPPSIDTKLIKTSVEEGELSKSSSNEGFHVISDEEISRSLSGTCPYAAFSEKSLNNSFHMATTKTVFDIEIDSKSQPFTEVWINAGGCYSIPVFIENENIRLIWEFMTEPRSIAFAIQYKEVDVEPSDVVLQPILPTTRCKSHMYPIHGSLVVRRKGIYTLIFDNRFSMIMAKKLMYKLKIKR